MSEHQRQHLRFGSHHLECQRPAPASSSSSTITLREPRWQVLILTPVVFALDIPTIIVFTVARYHETGPTSGS